ncbi:hypothetical protein [Oceanobacillus piezotolerans]|uniref:hypothetical protein n=1 Tax=Oceanobacillus piezotolerans TaxID=2448030 RepID=UPI001314F731|nr:hypothetical protein [Oceanobacillus piezotolerans]
MFFAKEFMTLLFKDSVLYYAIVILTVNGEMIGSSIHHDQIVSLRASANEHVL